MKKHKRKIFIRKANLLACKENTFGGVRALPSATTKGIYPAVSAPRYILFILCTIIAVMFFAAACGVYTARADEDETPYRISSPSFSIIDRTITVIAPEGYDIEDLEFALLAADGGIILGWQPYNIFEDVEYGAYLISMRLAGDITRYVTVPAMVRRSAAAPDNPLIAEITALSIRIAVPEGYKYLLEWRLLNALGAVERDWQNDPVFANLNPSTYYRVQARLAITLTHNPSPPSERTVRTLGGATFVPSPPESGCGNCGMFSAVGLSVIIGFGLIGAILVGIIKK